MLPADSPIAPPADAPIALSRRQLAHELLRRQRARVSLVDYARAIDIPGAPATPDEETEMFRPVEQAVATHHRLMCEAIQTTMETPQGRLMMFMPPGSAKSTYSAVVAPMFKLASTPGYRFILASYAAKIAWKQSRKARALARQEKQQAIWRDRPELNTETRAADFWALTNGSEYSAFGIQAGITGNRANGILGDDLLAGREEADSPVIRDKADAEWRDSASTRLLPGGWQILCNTRWHEDDPCGRILPEDYKGESGRILCRDGQWWNVINIPAKCEREDDPLGRQIGEYLWPEWFPRDHWAQWEHNPRAARTWAALFQQRPTAGEGIEFKREWFQWYDPDVTPGEPGGRPVNLTIYGASDYATKEGRGDFTEHGVAGVDLFYNLWFTDWWFDRVTTDRSIDAFVDLVANHHPKIWAHEGGPIDSAISPAVERAMKERGIYVRREALTSIKNKAIKLNSLQARAAQKKVYLPLRRAWATRLVDQLCAFPSGKYDDAADTAGLIARLLDVMLSPHAPKAYERKVIKPFTAEWLEYDTTPTLKPRYV